MPKRFYTTADIAGALNCSEKHVRTMIHTGEIAAILLGRHWRIPKDEFDSWLDARIAEAKQDQLQTEIAT